MNPALHHLAHHPVPHNARLARCPRAQRHGHPRERLHRFLRAEAFPCVGARAALARGTLSSLALGDFGDPRNDPPLLDALRSFGRRVERASGSAVHSLVAVYHGPRTLDAARFEAMLWTRLQLLHDLDVARGNPWAAGVGSDPADPRFSFSLEGHAFFVVGLHPAAPRLARRFEAPALVFNSHLQFERLRADGRFAKMQAAIRAREMALQGSINPALAEYGQRSEAAQYSGNPVGPGWRCPLRIHGGPR